MFDRIWLRDTAERVIATALQTFLALVVVTDLPTLRTAVVAGVAAGLSALKAAIAARVPGTISPSSVVQVR